MKKLQLFALIILLCHFLSAQNYTFNPNWKKGESQKYKVVKKTQDLSEGKEETEIQELEFTATVTGVTSENFELTIDYPNIAISSLNEVYEITEEAQPYQRLSLVFEIHKTKEEISLKNWEEARDFVFKSFDDIGELLEKKEEGAGSIVNMIMSPIKAAFKDEETTRAYFLTDLAFLFSPYNETFVLNKTKTIEQEQDNPFGGAEKLKCTVHKTLAAIEGANCTIEETQDIDFSEFKKMMKDMMLKMAQSMGATEKDMAPKLAEIDKMEMVMDNTQTINYDKSLGWVTSSKKEAIIKSNRNKKSLETESIVTVTAKRI